MQAVDVYECVIIGCKMQVTLETEDRTDEWQKHWRAEYRCKIFTYESAFIFSQQKVLVWFDALHHHIMCLFQSRKIAKNSVPSKSPRLLSKQTKMQNEARTAMMKRKTLRRFKPLLLLIWQNISMHDCVLKVNMKWH